jgi:hypothetical protein
VGYTAVERPAHDGPLRGERSIVAWVGVDPKHGEQEGTVGLKEDEGRRSEGLWPDAAFVVRLVAVAVQVRQDLGERGIEDCAALEEEAKSLVEESIERPLLSLGQRFPGDRDTLGEFERR